MPENKENDKINTSKAEQTKIYSEILKKEMGISLYLPHNYDCPSHLPVLYFLHGRSGNENILFELDILKTADLLIQQKIIKPLIIVCPRIDNSRGVNSSMTTREVTSSNFNGRTINLGRYEDYFIKEIIPFIDTNYKTITNREGRFVGGASAGGYAALNYGLRYPELFSKVGGHMPALELQLDQEDIPYFSTIDIWKKYNPLYIAKECAIPSDMQLYLDAGNKDEGEFYNGCLELYKILKCRKANVQNHLFEGHHNMAYIKSNLEKYLAFYTNQ